MAANGKKAASADLKLKAEIAPEELTAIVDTRERRPLDLSPLRACYGTLPTGDYSLVGLEHVVAIERKSLPDLLGCVGGQRRRFDREVQRLLAYPVRALIVEASWDELEAGQWDRRVTASAAIGSCLGWVASGLPVLMAGSRQQAGRLVSRLLWIAAQRRWRENRLLLSSLRSTEKAAAKVHDGQVSDNHEDGNAAGGTPPSPARNSSPAGGPPRGESP